MKSVTAEEGWAARRAMFEPHLEAQGITPEYLAKKLKEELEANEVKAFNSGKEGIVYSNPLVAWDVRQRARIDAHKLRGDYPIERKEISGPQGGPIPLTNFPPTAETLDEWQKQMEEAEAARLGRGEGTD